jgi:uncharacterized protein YdbL (DUF1318 family)
MNHLEGTKTVVGSVAASASNTTALLRLDTLGFDYASVDVVYAATPAAGTASAAAQTLTLKQSDAATTGYDTITGYPTVAAPTAAASSSVASVVRLDVDMRGKKRYIEIASSPNTNATVTIVARLGKGEVHPTAAAGKGVEGAFSG